MTQTKSILIIILFIAIIIVGGFYFINNSIYNEKQEVNSADHKSAEYVINGERIKLYNGLSEVEVVPGSASKVVTKYFGNELRKDLDGDGREDVVFLLTQESGGSGKFYYVVAALDTVAGFKGSQALFLGDRIAPQTTESGNNKMVIVNYAERGIGEDFSVSPSIGKSIWLILDPITMQFGEVAQNFEGEADPSVMKLDMKTWMWVKALYNDGKEIVPKQPGKFTLTFTKDGKFSVKTDCNSIGGSYTTTGNTISFSQIFMTKMFCEGSQERDFVTLLENTQSYQFTSKGELVLDLKFDSGSVTFR